MSGSAEAPKEPTAPDALELVVDVAVIAVTVGGRAYTRARGGRWTYQTTAQLRAGGRARSYVHPKSRLHHALDALAAAEAREHREAAFRDLAAAQRDLAWQELARLRPQVADEREQRDGWRRAHQRACDARDDHHRRETAAEQRAAHLLAAVEVYARASGLLDDTGDPCPVGTPSEQMLLLAILAARGREQIAE